MDSIEKLKKKILLIVNPCSGKTKTRLNSVDIMNEFPEDEYEFTMKATTCQGDATNIVKNELKDNDMVVCCGGAVVLGRAGDIIGYIFYTDHLTEWNNRAYLDKYLKSKDKKLLDDGNVYCMVDITNLVQINAKNSREVGDAIIQLFTRYLKEAFGDSKTEYIYNGNGSYVMLTEESDFITVEDIMHLFRVRLDERDEYREVVIDYRIGIAETMKENKTARRLLSEAIKAKKNYTSDLTE